MHAPNTNTDAAFEADRLEAPVDITVTDILPEDAQPALSSEAPTPVEVKKVRYRAKPKFSFPIPLKVVLIDLDGTLLDTVGDIIHAANLMRGTLGFQPLEAAVIRNFVGKGIPNLVAKTLNDAVGEGQVLIDAGHAIVHDHVRLLAHATEDLRAGQCRTNAVAVGTGVRGDDQASSSANFLEDLVQHGKSALSSLLLALCLWLSCCVFSRDPTTLLLGLPTYENDLPERKVPADALGPNAPPVRGGRNSLPH